MKSLTLDLLHIRDVDHDPRASLQMCAKYHEVAVFRMPDQVRHDGGCCMTDLIQVQKFHDACVVFCPECRIRLFHGVASEKIKAIGKCFQPGIFILNFF